MRLQEAWLAQQALQQVVGPLHGYHQQHAEQQRQRQGPGVQGLGCARLGRLLGHGLQLVEGIADSVQFGAVMGTEVGAVGDVGNFLERGFVQVQAR